MEVQNHTISELMGMVKAEMVRMQYSPVTVAHYEQVWGNLLRYAESKGAVYFTEEFGEQFLRDHYGYEHGYLERKYRVVNPPRMIRVLGHFQLHDVVLQHNHGSKKMKPPDEYAPLLDELDEHLRRAGLSESSIENVHRNVIRFVEYLHVNGIDRIDDLTMVVPRCVVRTSQPLPFIWKPEDVAKLLAAVDRANPVGKRNYAALMLVTQLGLRDSDIQNLKPN